MRLSMIFTVFAVGVTLFAGRAVAQEAKIHHGFLFFASEQYTVDEETFGVYKDGHLYEDLIKDNVEALNAFHSYETWHVSGIVMTALSLAAIVTGGVMYMPGVEKEVPSHTGAYIMAAGGGLLVLGVVFEFIAWGRISKSAEVYNHDLIDDGPALRFDAIPSPTLAFDDESAHFALTWTF